MIVFEIAKLLCLVGCTTPPSLTLPGQVKVYLAFGVLLCLDCYSGSKTSRLYLQIAKLWKLIFQQKNVETQIKDGRCSWKLDFILRFLFLT